MAEDPSEEDRVGDLGRLELVPAQQPQEGLHRKGEERIAPEMDAVPAPILGHLVSADESSILSAQRVPLAQSGEGGEVLGAGVGARVVEEGLDHEEVLATVPLGPRLRHHRDGEDRCGSQGGEDFRNLDSVGPGGGSQDS